MATNPSAAGGLDYTAGRVREFCVALTDTMQTDNLSLTAAFLAKACIGRRQDPLSCRGCETGLFQPLSEYLPFRHPLVCKFPRELHILGPAGDVLGYREIVYVQAKSRNSIGVLIFDTNQTLFPACGQSRGLRADPLSVVAELFMKIGGLANRTVDQICQFGFVFRLQVRVIEHVKEQNWFAVGIDFVIVVVGVFVGLQVQDWAASRAQADQQQRYYDRLHADFTAIKTRIEDQFAVFEGTIDGAGHVLELVRMPEDEFRDLEIDEQQLMAALTRLTPRRMPPGRSATYVEMLSASQLSAVSNETLRDKLAEYDKQSEIHLELFRYSADLTNTQIPIVYRHYKVLTTQDESVSSGIRLAGHH